MALLALFPVAAQAQDAGFNAVGSFAPPTDGDPGDPVAGFRPFLMNQGGVAVTLSMETVSRPLVQLDMDAGESAERALLASAWGLHLGGRFAVVDRRVEIGVAVPFWLTSGREVPGLNGFDLEAQPPTLGDAQIYVPVNVIDTRPATWKPGTRPSGLAWSFVARGTLPTGAWAGGGPERYLGDPDFGFALDTVVGAQSPLVGAVAQVGVGRRGFQAVDNALGDWRLRYGLAVSVTPGGGVGAGLELVGDAGFGSPSGFLFDLEEVAALPDARAELLGRFRVLLAGEGDDPDTDSGVVLGLAGGAGLTPSPGTAAWRLQATLGYRFGGQREAWLPPDVVVVNEPLDPDEPGVPQADLYRTALYVLEVTDERGDPVAGATLELGGRGIGGKTGPDGSLTFTGVQWRDDAVLRAPGFIEQTVRATEITEKGQRVRKPIQLDYQPVLVPIRVLDENDRPLVDDVTVDIAPGEGQEQPSIRFNEATGEREVLLVPGEWMLFASAPERVATTVPLTIAVGRRSDAPIEVRLLPQQGEGALVARFVDQEGRAVENAEVFVGGQALGRTGPGGTLDVQGLAEGDTEVVVRRDGFEDLVVPLQVTPDRVERRFEMRREGSQVQLFVTTEDQRVSNAVVRFVRDDGQQVGPFPVTEDGDLLQKLRPGRWRVVVAAPRYGLQERDVVIDEQRVRTVTINLSQPPPGSVDYSFRFVDGDGELQAPVEVLVDGRSKGTFIGSGRIVGLAEPGVHALTFRGEGLVTLDQRVALRDGVWTRDVPMRWKPGTVIVQALGPDRPVADGVARFRGPQSVEPLPLDANGEAQASLERGDYTVVVASPQLGLRSTDVRVDPTAEGPSYARLQFDAGEDGGTADLTVTVAGPTGDPVGGAALSLDGRPAGWTGADGLVTIEGLAPGRRSLTVRSAAYDDVTLDDVALVAGDNAVDVELDYGAGVVDVTVRDPVGRPVPDVLLRAAGPRSVSPMPAGSDGRKRMVLGPGTWRLIAASPTLGLTQADITLTADDLEPRPLDITMEPAPSNVAQLEVRGVDATGAAVPGLSITVGDRSALAESAGVVVFDALEPGAYDVRLTAPGFSPVTRTDVEVQVGSIDAVEVEMAYVPIPVEVRVLGPDDGPVASVLRLAGPTAYDPIRLGPGEAASLALRPGSWRLIGAAPQYGIAGASLDIAPGDPAQEVVIRLSATEEVALEGGTEVVLKGQVYFDLGRATVRDTSDELLDQVADVLRATPEIVQVEVQGHTDATGDVALNLRLSQSRASAVRTALIARGVPPERLVARGYGATRPVADNDTAEGRQQNRRVQFVTRTAAPTDTTELLPSGAPPAPASEEAAPPPPSEPEEAP